MKNKIMVAMATKDQYTCTVQYKKTFEILP